MVKKLTVINGAKKNCSVAFFGPFDDRALTLNLFQSLKRFSSVETRDEKTNLTAADKNNHRVGFITIDSLLLNFL